MPGKTMAIERGSDWGSPGRLPPESPDATSDAALAALIAAGTRSVRLHGGDVARTVGVNDASLARDAAVLLPIDAIEVSIDGDTTIAVAHVLVGSRRRPHVAVMNAAFVGRLNLAPRAHPGDGQLDVVTFDLSSIDWYKARRRMPTGAHVPHPGISTRRCADWAREPDAPVRVWVDGVRHPVAAEVRCRVVPEAVVVGV